ncbi:MAG: ChaN family lipoprotein [Magnetococcales bacterium]|nr:ChaN family lipoprotein [Magnetococcales bacterium]
MTPPAAITPTAELPIFAVNEGKVISRQDLLARMGEARVIYLGEKHDNPTQHQLQREIIQNLVEMGKRPAIGLEFFSRAQTSWLLNFTEAKQSPMKGSAAESSHASLSHEGESLRQRLGWEQRPEWDFYYPLILVARHKKLPVFGADLPQGMRFHITRVGMSGISPVERALIPSTGFVHEDYRQLMQKQLSEAHCGAAAPDLLDRLYATWVARNDTMAASITAMLKELPSSEPIVMILGAGHVARDMGVLERVAHLNPGVRQLNLGFKEISASPATSDFATYQQPVQVGNTRFAPEHGYLWFTPPAPATDAPDQDPCALFRKRHPPVSEKPSPS